MSNGWAATETQPFVKLSRERVSMVELQQQHNDSKYPGSLEKS
jgi:hypothetical protein